MDHGENFENVDFVISNHYCFKENKGEVVVFNGGIVVLNWINFTETIECLTQLFGDAQKISIALVENGSPNESFEKIKRFLSIHSVGGDASSVYQGYPVHQYHIRDSLAVYFIQSDVNLGFAGGCNLGISFLSQQALDYIFLLNSDARIEFSHLQLLCNISHSLNAVVGPTIRDMNGLLSFSGYSWPQLLWSRGKYTLGDQNIWESAYVEGSACVLPITFIREKYAADGYIFDERYFLYCEDVDLCLSARKLGYKVLVTQLATASHKVSASSGGMGSVTAYYYITRNRWLLTTKWLSPFQRIIFRVYYILSRLVLIAIRTPIRAGRVSNRAVFEGLKDAIYGRYGFRRRE